ncbi:MAG: hypothetical protein Aurels2KO_41850 [Aureliella sp.]
MPDLLAVRSRPNDQESSTWHPKEFQTPVSALSAIRRIGPLPDLYESLALTYRWLAVDLVVCRLLPNPPATDLLPLAESIYADPVLNNSLLSAGLVRFALAPGGCYDPICFDLSRMVRGDCPVVRIDHESVLMHNTVRTVATVFGSFRSLVVDVIESI